MQTPAAPSSTPSSATPSGRDQATDFSLPNLNGDTVSLSDTRGKVTVVNF